MSYPYLATDTFFARTLRTRGFSRKFARDPLADELNQEVLRTLRQRARIGKPRTAADYTLVRRSNRKPK